MSDRETHSLCVVPCKDVSEISSRHAEAHLPVAVGEEPEVRVEVVGDLEHDASKIDGVDSAKRVLLLELD